MCASVLIVPWTLQWAYKAVRSLRTYAEYAPAFRSGRMRWLGLCSWLPERGQKGHLLGGRTLNLFFSFFFSLSSSAEINFLLLPACLLSRVLLSSFFDWYCSQCLLILLLSLPGKRVDNFSPMLMEGANGSWAHLACSFTWAQIEAGGGTMASRAACCCPPVCCVPGEEAALDQIGALVLLEQYCLLQLVAPLLNFTGYDLSHHRPSENLELEMLGTFSPIPSALLPWVMYGIVSALEQGLFNLETKMSTGSNDSDV